MNENGSSSEITNHQEGPRYKITVEFSAEKFFSFPLQHHNQAVALVYDQILEKIPPESELNKAMQLAIQEKSERAKLVKTGQKITWGEEHVDGSKQFAFRGFRRKSNGTGLGRYPTSTYNQGQESLYEVGSDGSLDKTATNIQPCTIWDMFLFPTPPDIEDKHEDISTILVYRNEPFVFPTDGSQQTTTLVDLNIFRPEKRERTISVEEAKKEDYPTLRDNLVGEIEIRWV